ncbi:xanthine dehydrogenase FAD-binding subunit [Escherichia coli]|uniref:Xanthine dehydrogenase FAD-binding subunit n=1 Tax=Escherichia coli TaxID=562 RepID=A0A376LBE8_ECOLX|nr:xanthine dehydrogenase FAD-binding subunit [Escherichia coli]
MPHIADWITAISANYAWHLVLPRQRRFAANMPNRLHKMRPLNLQTLEAISESVLQDVAPRSSWRASKEFRLHLIQTMTKKVISEAVAATGGKLQ